jgi:hypothetical protein
MSQLTIAISEHLVKEAFKGVVDSFSFTKSDSKDCGAFSASYSVSLHLQGGTVEMRDDNTILIKELDVKFDTLSLNLGLDIPEFCIGGWCIVPWFNGCAVRLPRYCAFGGDPDITLPIDLSHLITSELSVSGGPMIRYVVDPGRDPTWSDWEAEENGKPNTYQIFINPDYVDFDLFDVADMVGDLAEALNQKIRQALSSLGFPYWAVDGLMALLGPIPALLREILDIGDDFGEWLKDIIGNQLGFFKALLLELADYFKVKLWIYAVNDPYRIMKAIEPDPNDPGIIPKVAVKLKIDQLAARINAQEMILEGSVGGQA